MSKQTHWGNHSLVILTFPAPTLNGLPHSAVHLKVLQSNRTQSPWDCRETKTKLWLQPSFSETSPSCQPGLFQIPSALPLRKYGGILTAGGQSHHPCIRFVCLLQAWSCPVYLTACLWTVEDKAVWGECQRVRRGVWNKSWADPFTISLKLHLRKKNNNKTLKRAVMWMKKVIQRQPGPNSYSNLLN